MKSSLAGSQGTRVAKGLGFWAALGGKGGRGEAGGTGLVAQGSLFRHGFWYGEHMEAL